MDLLAGISLVAEVRCPHRTGLAYLLDGGGQPMLATLPCPCNDPSEVIRVFAEVGSFSDEETKS